MAYGPKSRRRPDGAPGKNLRACALVLAAAAMLAGVLSPPARADGLPTSPILQIETGNHTATIRDIKVRADGAVVATVSDDKTMRLWDAATGELLETVRTPVGPDEEGVLNTVEYWPGESHIITSGFTGGRYFADAQGRRQNLLYFVRFSSGLETIDRVATGGIVNAIDTHRPSADGKATLLASAHTRNPSGVTVIDQRLKRVFSDDLGAATNWVEFAQDGRLAAVAENGVVRLYDNDFSTVKEWNAPDGRPAQVRFSPNGAQLAVAYANRPRVDILDVGSMRRATSLSGDVPGTATLFLSAVAWRVGAKGDELWASGGVVDRNRDIVVRRWRSVDRPDDFTDIPVSRDAVTRLETTPEGDILFATGDPAWGRVAGENGRLLFRVSSPKADFRRLYESVFRTSEDGTVVDFSFRAEGRDRTLRFDAKTLSLEAAPEPAPGFARPAPPSGLEGWRDSPEMTLDGRLVRLSSRRDIARSATELTDDGFVVGSDYSLSMYAADGTPQREAVVLSAASAVVATPDGKRLVVAHRDGTIRWYSLVAGQELEEIASLFVHADGRRWILWSPDGHFTHSVGGGQELAGYVLNRGRKQVARWIDFSQLYKRFYDIELMRYRVGLVQPANVARPDAAPEVENTIASAPSVTLVRFCAVADTGDDTACYPANQLRRGLSRKQSADAPPAAVSLLPEGHDRVRLVFEITPGSEPVTRYDVFLNDRTTGQAFRGLSRKKPADTEAVEVRTVEKVVTVSPGLNKLYVRAYSTSGVFGKSHELTLKVPEPEAPPEPTLYVIAVGIDIYKGDIQDLSFARRDADSVSQRISQSRAPLYKDVQVVSRFDEEATAEGIQSAFDSVAERIKPVDTVVVYIAGHGVIVDGGVYHFISHNVEGIHAVPDQAIDQDRLVGLLGSLLGANTMVFLDTCHSGALPTDTPGEIGNDTGYFILAASSETQEALDGYNGRNGVFAHAILSELDSRRASGQTITAFDLGSRVPARVEGLAKSEGYTQTAEFKSGGKSLRDFPLAAAQ